MNRRDFIKNSLLTSVNGLGGKELLIKHSQQDNDTQIPHVSSKPSTTKRFVYAHFQDPREHPDYLRRHVQPPNWDTFDGQVRFTGLREFDIVDGQIVGYVEKIKKYAQTYQLGDVLWIRYPFLFAGNLEDLVNEVQRQKLFLFDVWGYVPGSGPGGPWQQFQTPPDVFELLESKLGDYWLGMDNGEQDGRYINNYSAEFYPASGDRRQQYLNFHRHFERLTSQLGNRLATLTSFSFGHYFLKEGLYTLIGAETAQGLPNGQVRYSFVRGAGKQYGVLWFGNASVYNRWGWKSYGPVDEDSGPAKGTSLSLMKRLMYSQILYNSVLVGFETSFFTCSNATKTAGACHEEELSPIGLMQQAAGKWLRETGKPGPMLTPVAIIVDFFAGWIFPRRDSAPTPVYRVWGNLPYGAGDYLTDGVLDMLYPGYQNASFYHDESGFLTPTPYGDVADCILSDAPEWLLTRYPMILVTGELQGGAEVRDKFESYVTNGGHLLITAGNLLNLPNGLAGIHAKEDLTHFPAGTAVRVGQLHFVEENSFDLCALTFPKMSRVLAEFSGVPAAIELSVGKGRITVFASPFGLASNASKEAQAGLIENLQSEVDRPLAKPFPLLKWVRHILSEALSSQMFFDTGENLSLITCRKDPGEYILGVSNPTWQQSALNIRSLCGRIESIRELTLDESEKTAPGYVPETLGKVDLGISDDNNIAGGDIRIFAVQVKEENIEEIPHIAPPARPRRRALPLRGINSIKEEVLMRPSFFEHFDSVVVDWKYLHSRERAQLEQESKWIHLQKLNILVDLTSGINLFPNLRLVDNSQEDYSASLKAIEDVIAKMQIFSGKHLIFSLHRYPENNFSQEQIWQSFKVTLHDLCENAHEHGIKAHLRLRFDTPPANLNAAADFIDRVNAKNLDLAPSTAFLFSMRNDLPETTKLLRNKVGLWLVNVSETDIAGSIWNENAPIRGCREPKLLANILATAPEAPVVFDAVYKDYDEEYLDALFLRKTLAGNTLTG